MANIKQQIKRNKTNEKARLRNASLKSATKSAVKGVDCILKNASIAVSLANSLKTSLGPCGSDKILVSPDNALTITNDGATIVKSI